MILMSVLVSAALLAFASTCSVAYARTSQDERTLHVVMAFYDFGWPQKKPSEAFQQDVSKVYIQHNPQIADGPQAAIDYLEKRLREFPLMRIEVRDTLSDHGEVMLHVLVKETPADRGRAFVDIFKVVKGKIVEHWDVIEPIPETSANTHPMF